MPELPEVETVRRGLAPVMENARISALELRRVGLRYPFVPDLCVRINGAKITSLSRRAKYLLIHTDRQDVLISHLGMSGSYRIEEGDIRTTPGQFHHARSALKTHDHVIFHLDCADGAQRQIIYNDPRRFGFIEIARSDALYGNAHLAHLGIEPTSNTLGAQELADRLAGKATVLKAALLDQRLIAGLGNIYVCEALWRARLSPRRKAGTLVRKDGSPTARCERLAGDIRTVIAQAIEAGGSSLRDHRQADGTLGYFQHSFNVYDRSGTACGHSDCKGTIERIVQNGRSTFFCPSCQR